MPGFNDVLTLVPEFADIYDEGDNPGVDIKTQGLHSPVVVNFYCKKCGHRWSSSIAGRIKTDKDGRPVLAGCPECCNGHKRSEPYSVSYPWLYDICDEEASGRKLSSITDYSDCAKFKFVCVCPDCHQRYRATVRTLIRGYKYGHVTCPYCTGQKKTPGRTSFKAMYPDLMPEWDLEKNSDIADPDTISKWAKISVWWKCPDGHSYQMEPIQRIKYRDEHTEACPYCNGRIVTPGVDSFKALHPDLMKEWLYLPNSLLADPDRISERSDIEVWWECPRGHHYRRSPARRILFQKRGRDDCPICKGYRLKRRHFY